MGIYRKPVGCVGHDFRPAAFCRKKCRAANAVVGVKWREPDRLRKIGKCAHGVIKLQARLAAGIP